MPLFTPIDDQILVRRDAAVDSSRGGIVLPERDRVRPLTGVVLAVGPGRRTRDGQRLPLSIEAGQQVMFTRYSGTEVLFDDVVYLVIREADVLGVLEKDPEPPVWRSGPPPAGV